MFSVTLLGTDGAGKSTLIRKLPERLPAPMVPIYMGVSLESSNRLLPTSRLLRAVKRTLGRNEQAGPPTLSGRQTEKGGWLGPVRGLYAWVRCLNLMAEEWYRLGLASFASYRGWIAIFDRHFFADYYFHGIAESSGLAAPERLHVWMLRNIYPRPGLVILLDGPTEILHARKPEGDLPALQNRRKEYLALAEILPQVEVIDATDPLESVLEQVARLISRHYSSRGRAASCSWPFRVRKEPFKRAP